MKTEEKKEEWAKLIDIIYTGNIYYIYRKKI